MNHEVEDVLETVNGWLNLTKEPKPIKIKQPRDPKEPRGRGRPRRGDVYYDYRVKNTAKPKFKSIFSVDKSDDQRENDECHAITAMYSPENQNYSDSDDFENF